MAQAQCDMRYNEIVQDLKSFLDNGYKKTNLHQYPGRYFSLQDIIGVPEFSVYSAGEIGRAIESDGCNDFDIHGDRIRRKVGNNSQSHDVRLSKTLSWLLRHGAEEAAIPMDEGGYVSVERVLQMRQFRGYTLDDIRRVVMTNDKQRFLLADCGADGAGAAGVRIKACQGHSMEVPQLDLRPVTDASSVACAVHGTTRQAWERAIRREGLHRMSRTHIHFATGLPGADGVISGMKRSAEVALVLDVAGAMRDGIKFYQSENNVILTTGDANGYVLPRYFTQVIDLKSGCDIQSRSGNI